MASEKLYRNTLTNIESIARITNLAKVHTYKEERLRRPLQLVTNQFILVLFSSFGIFKVFLIFRVSE